MSVQLLKPAAKKNQRRGQKKKIKSRVADLIFSVQECEKARIICFMYDSGVGKDMVTGGLLCQRLGRSCKLVIGIGRAGEADIPGIRAGSNTEWRGGRGKK